MKQKQVTILGTVYQLKEVEWEDDKLLKKYDWCGYCSGILNEIIYARPDSMPNTELAGEKEKENDLKQTLRHEIIHAFLYESGLSSCACAVDMWARNEEMVDYFAIQFPKILAVYQELDLL